MIREKNVYHYSLIDNNIITSYYQAHMKNLYSHDTTISFKCSPLMMESMNKIMVKRYIDRSSVIRLALYLLDAYLHKMDIAEDDLFQLVEKLENFWPQHEHSFSEFCGFNN